MKTKGKLVKRSYENISLGTSYALKKEEAKPFPNFRKQDRKYWLPYTKLSKENYPTLVWIEI